MGNWIVDFIADDFDTQDGLLKKLDYVQNSIKKLRGSIDNQSVGDIECSGPSFGAGGSQIVLSPKKNNQVLIEVNDREVRFSPRKEIARSAKDKEGYFVHRIDTYRRKMMDFKQFKGSQDEKIRLLSEENKSLKHKIEEYVIFLLKFYEEK